MTFINTWSKHPGVFVILKVGPLMVPRVLGVPTGTGHTVSNALNVSCGYTTEGISSE